MSKKTEDILRECKANFVLAIDAEGENRSAALEDLKFAAGDQWPADISAARELENRPCLTINKTDTFVRQVVNNMRQQRPRMVAHPVSDGADEEVSEVIQGLLRHIEVNSNADVAYDSAADFQVRMGWGYWRVATRYVDERSFEQEIYIDRVKNPFTVYMEPHEQPDGSDATWALVTEMVKREDFRAKWPKAREVAFQYAGAGDDGNRWASEKEVRVAEYWKVERTPDVLLHLSNGWVVFKSETDDEALKVLGATVVQERPSFRRQVKCYKVSAQEILEEKVWPGKYIPIIPVYGAELVIDGKVIRYGMTRFLKDPQRMYNFWRTAETEIVALAPKAPWLMAEGQDEGHEDEWDSANVRSYSSLKYKPKLDEAGNQLPPPQRQQPQQIPAAQVTAAQGASEDMKAVAGIFDPSLGNKEGDPSGIALQRHQQQSDMSNFHFYDNFTRSVRFTGLVCLDLIPKIYDTQRVMRIIGEDGNAKAVTINEKQRDEAGEVTKVLNDVTVGRYDVVMDTGPGYQTKRLEAQAFMSSLLATPLGEQIGHLAGDIVVRHFDAPGAREIADRLAAMNPIAQDEALPDFPPEAQAMIKHLQASTQQLQQALQQLQTEKKAKVWGDAQWQATEIRKEEIRAEAKRHDTNTWAAQDTAQGQLKARTDLQKTELQGATSRDVEEIRAAVQLLAEHVRLPLELKKLERQASEPSPV